MRRMQVDRILHFQLRQLAKAFIHHLLPVDRTFRRTSGFIVLYAGHMVNPVLLSGENPRGDSVLRKGVAVEHAGILAIRDILDDISAVDLNLVKIEQFTGLLA
ncbi:hypothetical protein D1872_304340 [compost metagenome]